VARPVVLDEEAHRVGGERERRFVVVLGIPSEEVLGERRNLVAALPERRGGEADAVWGGKKKSPGQSPGAAGVAGAVGGCGAAAAGTSTRTSCEPPSRANSPSCSTCSSLLCSVALISLISSRNIVP